MIYIGKTSLQKIFEKLLGYFAPLESPKLKGTPTAPTPAADAADDSQQIANVAYVKANGGKVDTTTLLSKTEAASTYFPLSGGTLTPNKGISFIGGSQDYTGKISVNRAGQLALGVNYTGTSTTPVPYKASVEIDSAFAKMTFSGYGGSVVFDVSDSTTGTKIIADTFDGTAIKAVQDTNGNQIDTTYATVDWVKQFIEQKLAPAVVITGTISTGNTPTLFKIINATVSGKLSDGTTATIDDDNMSFRKITNSIGGFQTISWSNDLTNKRVSIAVTVNNTVNLTGTVKLLPPQSPGIALDTGEMDKLGTQFTDGTPITITITLADSTEG